MEFEIINGSYAPKAPRFGGFADSSGWCALYSRLASNYVLLGGADDKEQRLWTAGNVWDFSENNIVSWDSRKDEPFDHSKLKKGQILGINIPHNQYEERLRGRYKFDFNHMACYAGHYVFDGKFDPWIFHNLEGDIKSQSLISFLCYTGSEVIQVFKPREGIIS